MAGARVAKKAMKKSEAIVVLEDMKAECREGMPCAEIFFAQPEEVGRAREALILAIETLKVVTSEGGA